MYYLGTFGSLAGLRLKDFCLDNHGNWQVQMQKMESSQTALVSRSVCACVFHVGLRRCAHVSLSTRTFKSLPARLSVSHRTCPTMTDQSPYTLDSIRHKQGRALISSLSGK